jgi:uncharacterized membrane protein
MTAFTDLLQHRPLIAFHLVTALAALLIGALLLLRRKGTGSHRAWGWAWVLLMGITPIHAFTVMVAVQLPRGIHFARQGNTLAHRQTMRSLYIGGCIVAGLFTLLPGRFLGHQLWHAVGLL